MDRAFKIALWALIAIVILLGIIAKDPFLLWWGIIVLVLLPPDLDPAIQLKEHFERKNRK